ncbi:SGNH/GDSL hydrolase family protein [Hugenholtzia roseola]|uniref:SGNH/GDSL hydrolase family protein n=1 Tax=Hugenholtzia roseola TaxID=1002 RepID=UPI0003FF5F24|nr:SGNH/GDSL hydrolase family protein [Hugenholtzia roseola]
MLTQKLQSYLRYFGMSLMAGLVLTACEPELDPPTPSKGTADFSKYIALGNSLTSGYADGALYRQGQINSYPNMIATSLKEAGLLQGEFKQPLVPEGNGSGGASGRLQLQIVNGAPLPVATENDPTVFQSVAAQAPFQNLGVPGARSFHLVTPLFGAPQGGNPFFTRFCTAPGEKSVLDEAVAQAPTFFTLWIGNNDVLGYALAGGDGGAGDQITSTQVLQGSIAGVVGGLKQANPNVKGAIANIPAILKIPYFTFIPHNFLSQEQATLIYTGVRAAVEAQARPTVEAAVRQQVTAAVAQVVRETMVTPQVTAAVRQQVVAQVTATVREQARQQALAQGASEAQAAAAADAFVASAEGQALIEQNVEAQMASEQVQALIAQNVEAQMASPQVQAGIEAEVNTRMQSAEIQAIIAQQLANVVAAIGLPSEIGAQNPFLIETERTAQNPAGIRVATPEDMILLAVGSYVSTPAFQAFPVLPGRFVLDSEEQGEINNAIASYNSVIAEIAQANDLALVDMSGFFNEVQSGFVYNGVSYSPTFITGGAFSLDGIHLTDRGYALAANEFIKAINAKYNATISPVPVNQYRGILFP